MSNMTETKSGIRIWENEKGQYHRTDGPAVEFENGDKEWWVNGKRHRTDGPAVERSNGDKIWWLNGKLHRTDGPALEWVSGDKSWYVEGVQYTEEEFNSLMGVEKELDLMKKFLYNKIRNCEDDQKRKELAGTSYGTNNKLVAYREVLKELERIEKL